MPTQKGTREECLPGKLEAAPEEEVEALSMPEEAEATEEREEMALMEEEQEAHPTDP